ncbi:hypothetical protein M404DRAFT_818963 [Pisolithus tinctorius Marx 270]|uniref:Uncharacterized protein n=1 Tax=Pisolithus tinctorius Marx 270 TaxID=870435 RepID=A0A0C3NVE9_PISTI|nr:hypothetical protein M404DRAFT_818963 [Pisolithus tinctorius Marx 270]
MPAGCPLNKESQTPLELSYTLCDCAGSLLDLSSSYAHRWRILSDSHYIRTPVKFLSPKTVHIFMAGSFSCA